MNAITLLCILIVHMFPNRMLILDVTAAVLSNECPYTSSWPNCKLNIESFIKITDPLKSLSPYSAINLSPILKTSEIPAYEAFSKDFCDSSGYGHLNISDHIFAVSSEVGRYQEVDASSAKGKYDILVPVFEISPLKESQGAILYNMYADAVIAKTIDYTIDTHLDESLPTTAVSEFLFLVQDGVSRPSSVIVQPISPLYNSSIVVGVALGVLR
jgi:hypothetical protein